MLARTKRIIDYDEKITASMMDVRGPSDERMAVAGEHLSIGGQDRGVRVYQMHDTPLDRLYARLVRSNKTENSLERLRVEYAALNRYHRLYVESGMTGSIGSVDPNRTYSPSPSGRDFCGKTDRQCDDRNAYRQALVHLERRHPDGEDAGHRQRIVVDNVVNNERSLEIAGYSIGKNSQRRAIATAEAILRDAGYRLARHWGMVR